MIPVLHTDRLTLRGPCLADFDAYAAMRGDAGCMAFLGGPQSRAQAWHHFAGVAGQWLLRGYGRWIVTATGGDDAVLGLVGIFHADDWPEPEIGWILAPGAERRGYAGEAALAARAFAYGALGWRTIVSMIVPGNARSEDLARRLGCAPDGIFAHETLGDMNVWRHPSPGEAAA